MNKYEKLIEYIINDEDSKARALFHEIVVEKSRDIYESLMDEEQYDEGMGGNPVNGMMDSIQADEAGLPEDEEMDMGGDDEMLGGDDMGSDDMGGEGDIEDRVMDLETELDALKAEFEQLMGDEAGEEEHSDMDDMGGDDMGGEESDEEEFAMEATEEEEVEESLEESAEEEEEEEEETVEESRRYKSEIELMREYVEKVTAPANSEGHEVGKGGSVAVNKTSITDNMKNDMGGTTANIAKGGAEADPSGTPANKTAGVLKKGDVIDVAKRNVNVPGGNKGAQDFYGTKAKAKSGEEGGVNKSSIEGGK